LTGIVQVLYLQPGKAEVAHLVEHDLAKVGVAGSSPVFRSHRNFQTTCLDFFLANICFPAKTHPGGGTGRHAGLKILWPTRPYGFNSRPGYKAPQIEGFFSAPASTNSAIVILHVTIAEFAVLRHFNSR
jgi:hypothetical protein